MKLRWPVFLAWFTLAAIGAQREAYAQEEHSFLYPFASEDAYTNVWPLDWSYEGHQGVDYACPEGTPVYASITGTVTVAKDDEFTKSCVGFGNTIVIQQGGCTVRYAHLLGNSVPFEVGDTVMAGDLVGETSNTGYSTNIELQCLANVGYHLHYEVHCNGSAGLNPYPWAAVDDRVNNEYEDGQDLFIIDDDGSYHFPQETLFDHHDSPMVCANQPTGDASTNWYYTCNEKGVFQEGDEVWVLLRLHDVDVDHRFRVRAYKDNVYQWDWTTNANDVGSEGWQYSHFWPELMYALPGEWRFDLFFVLEGAEGPIGEVYVDSASFTVHDEYYFHISTFSGESFDYDGNGYTCPGPVVGGESTNWVYTCGIPRTTFEQGETVYGLVRIDDVTANFRFSVDAYKDGAYQWNYTGGWNDVGQWGWSMSYFPILLQNAQPGDWEFRVSVDEGSGFDWIETLDFSVSPASIPPYQYDGLVTCSGPVSGGAGTNWVYTCENPTSSFNTGDAAYALVRIDDVMSDHRWKEEVYINGSYQWNWTTDWFDVGEWGWSWTYFAPTTSSVWPGNWEYRIYLDVGSGFQYLDSAYFTVN